MIRMPQRFRRKLCCFFPVFWLFCALASLSAQVQPPQFSKNALLNGLEIFFLPSETGRSEFALMIKNGAAFDPLGKWGVTNLMAHLTLERTERRTGDQIREDLKLMNAQLDVTLDWDAIFYHGSAPQERLGDVLNILAEVVTKPVFVEDTLEVVRDRFIREMQDDEGTVERLTQQRFIQELFGENPYSHTVVGEPKQLNAVDLTDVKIQYRRLFMPNQAQLALTYSGDEAKLFRSLGRSWGGWIRGDAVPFTFRQADPIEGPHILLFDRNVEQSVFRFGSLAVEKNSPDFYALKVLEQYLTLSLPDWAKDVVSKDQVIGGVHLDARRMPGYMQLSILAPPEDLVLYVDKLHRVLKDLQDGQLNMDRFKEAKELAVLELSQTMIQPLPRLLEMLRVSLYEVGLRYITSYGIRLERVSPRHLSSALTKYFSPDSYLLVAAGPADLLAPRLKKFGPVDILN